MAIDTIPPWLQITPETFTGAMKAGAGVGAELRGQDITARGQDLTAAEARDRLTLAYAQLQSQEELAAEKAQATLSLAHAHLQATKEQNDLMNEFRASHQDLAERQTAALEDIRNKRLEDLIRHREETEAQGRERLGLQKQMDEMRMAQQRIDPLDQFDLRDKASALRSARSAYSAAVAHGKEEAIAAAKKALDDATTDYTSFRESLTDKYKKAAPPTPDEAPAAARKPPRIYMGPMGPGGEPPPEAPTLTAGPPAATAAATGAALPAPPITPEGAPQLEPPRLGEAMQFGSIPGFTGVPHRKLSQRAEANVAGLEAALNRGFLSAGAGLGEPEEPGLRMPLPGDPDYDPYGPKLTPAQGGAGVPATPAGFQWELKTDPETYRTKLTKGEAIGRGLGAAGAEFLDALTSPVSFATLGMGGVPAGARRAIAAYFAEQMLSQTPEIAKQAIDAYKKKDWETFSHALGNGATAVGFGVAAAWHALGPEPTVPRPPTEQVPPDEAKFPRFGPGATVDVERPGLAFPDQRLLGEGQRLLGQGEEPELDAELKKKLTEPRKETDATRIEREREHIGAAQGPEVPAESTEVRTGEGEPDSSRGGAVSGEAGQAEVQTEVKLAEEAPKVSPTTEALQSRLSDPEATVDNKHSHEAGLGAKSIADLDAFLDLRKQEAKRQQEVREKLKDPNLSPDDKMKLLQANAYKAPRAQVPREAIEVATNSGSWVEGEGSTSVKPLGERPLDWSKNPEVAKWLLDHGKEMGWSDEAIERFRSKVEAAKKPTEAPTPPAELPPTELPTPKPEEVTPQAAAKVQTEVTKAAEAEGERSAKHIKAELVDKIQKQIEAAPTAAAVGTKAKKIKISIPGDGDFDVFNTKEALGEMLSRAKRISTSPGAKTAAKVPISREERLNDEEVNKVISAYGSVEKAYQSVKRQRDAIEAIEPRSAQDVSDMREQMAKADALLDRLYAKTKAGQLSDKAEALRDRISTYQEGAKGFDKEIARIEAIKHKRPKHKAELTDLKARRAENQLRIEQMDIEARKTELESEKEKESLNPKTEAPKPAETAPAAEAPKPPETPPTEPGERGKLYLNPIWEFFKPVLEPVLKGLQKLRQVLVQRLNERPVRHQVDQFFDASDNLANIAGQRAGKGISIGISREADLAGSAAIAAGFDPRRLPAMLASVVGKNKDAETAIRYAMAHWNEAVAVGRKGQDAFNAQLQSENAVGINTMAADDYLPGVYDTDLWMGHGRPFTLGRTAAGGAATGFRKGKTYATPFDAVADGYTPRTLRLSELVEHRVRQGQRLINRRAFVDSLRGLNSVSDGKPIVADMITRSRGPGLPDYQVAPTGYVPRQLLPGTQTVAVHEDFAKLIDALNGNSKISEFEPGGIPVGDIALATAGGIKHGLLVFDTFHASRIMQKQMFLKGWLPSWNKGRSLLEYNVADLNRAVAAGEITPEIANWVRTNKPLADLLIKHGLNVGRVQEQMRQGLSVLPGFLKTFNKWVFEKMTRGAMMEGALLEFERARKANPGLSHDEIAQKVARDLNAYFGNLGHQGIFKSATFLDASRLAFLAPQWVESMARSEIGGLAQLARVPYDSVRARRLMVGTLGTGLSRGLLAYFVGTQVLNLITRKQFTWDNDEKGHKMDAWIPDITGKSDGFFISPMGVVAELTHDMFNYMNKGENLLQAANHIRQNRSSPLWRAGSILMGGRDWNDEKIVGAWNRVKQAAWALAPTPIPLQAATKGGGPPGQLQRQITASAGFKTEPVGTPASQVFQMARDWMAKSGDPKTLHKLETAQKQDFGESDYKPLRKALTDGDIDASIEAYHKLLDEGKDADDVFKAMRPWTVYQAGGQYFRNDKPLAGLSGAEEQKFIKSLTPAERGIVIKARKQREETFQRFQDMLRKEREQKPVAPMA